MGTIKKEELIQHFTQLSETLKNIQELVPPPEDQFLQDILDQSRIDLKNLISAPPTCLQIVDAFNTTTLGTLGNFSAVIGKAKSKKTFFVTMAIATAIKNDIIYNKIKASLPEDRQRILHFDTEQSKDHVQKVVIRATNIAETSYPKHFDSFGLRSLNPRDRVEVIDYALKTINNIGLVVIDGIRDLVNDINSPEEATQIVSRLMKWSEEKNIHILVALHQNKGDNNARGHLGTEIINKAETVISVTKDSKDPDISIVEPEFCRDKEFPPFAFKIDSNGMPFILDDWQPIKDGKKLLTPFDTHKETHFKILKEIFRRTEKPQYGQLVEEIKYSFQQHGIKGGDNKAKEWIKYYENQSMISKSKESGNKYPIYILLIK